MSWGNIIQIIAHLWAVLELLLQSSSTLCFYGSLNQIQSVLKGDIFSYSLPHDLLVATIHSDKTASVLLRSWGPHRLRSESIGFLFSPSSLIYRPLFPHFFVSLLCLRLPSLFHPACSLEASLLGPPTRRSGSIVPNPDHRAAGSVPAAFIVFGLCAVIKGVSVILAIKMLEKLRVSSGEGICRQLICLCTSEEKQNVTTESLSLAFAALLRVCERRWNTCQRKVHFVFTVHGFSFPFFFICSCFSPPLNFPRTIIVPMMVRLSAGVYFNFNVLSIWV